MRNAGLEFRRVLFRSNPDNHYGVITHLEPDILEYEVKWALGSICWIIEKAREFQKNIYLSFIDYAKAFDCVDHNKLENS